MKNKLNIFLIVGLTTLVPIISIGRTFTSPVNNPIYSTAMKITIPELNRQPAVSIHEIADNDTVKNILAMDEHYPGGVGAWSFFFKRNFRYPEDAIKNGIDRLVTARIIVSKKGKVKKAEIVNGINRSYDNSILTIIKWMPDWKPFLKDGVPVEVPIEIYIPLYQDSPAAIEKEFKDDEVVTKQIDQLPRFPGGNDMLKQFLHSVMLYPRVAWQQGIQGTVYVRFVVRSTGKVTDVEVRSGIGRLCDEEAVRVVKEMPKWFPGRDNGKAVSVYCTLPITFKLPDNPNLLMKGSLIQ